jgi:predicted porin
MKKILLGTTTLIGATGLFAGAALADGPKVTLGGVADFQVGVVNEDLDTNQRSQAFRSDTELTFRVDGKTDGGLGYGGGVDVETDTTADSDNQGTNASKTFVYLSGDNWGRFEGGSTTGVAAAMKVDASRIARATGGIDGDFRYFLDSATNAVGTHVIATPELPLDYGFDGVYTNSGTFGDEGLENANKVSYYTPRFAGFQLGVSYLVDTQRGQTVNRNDIGATAATDSLVENVFEGGISYEGKFSDVGFAAAVTGTTGDATVATTEDLQAWNAGVKFSYMGFSVAGSYGDWGDSLRVTGESAFDDNDYFTVGAAYETGPFGVSVTYLDSTYQSTATVDNEFQNISVGVDYKLAPGLTPYAEVSFIDNDVATAAADNDGTVFIAGTQLSF